MKRQTLIKGTFILGFAGVFARFLGLFFRIPVQHLIGDEGMGYYQMSYPLYMTFVAVASGIPIAISKIISEMNAQKDTASITHVLKVTMLIMIPIGGVFSAILLIFSESIITSLKWDIKSYYSFIAIALAPIFVVIMGTFRGFFQGLHNMEPTAMSQVIEQIGRVLVGVGLASLLFPYGIEYAAGGAALGTVAGAILGSIYLFFTYLKIKREFPVNNSFRRNSIVGIILKTGIPISFGAVVGTIMTLVDSIVVPRQLLKAGLNSKGSAILFGQLTGKASTLVNVPLALSMALSAAIVPIIAEAYVTNRRFELNRKVQTAIKLSCVISIPSALGLYFMAFPIINLVFRGDTGGYTILKYLSISVPFIILCQSSTALLQAMNKFYRPVINLFIGCIIKVIITYVLVPVPSINIYGAVIGSISGYCVACFLNMYLLRKRLKMSINYYEITIKPGYAAAIMAFVVVFSYRYVYNYTMSNTISCLLSITLGAIVYSVFIVVFRVFSYSEIKKRFPEKFR
jgi:stage V sporulation protein B